MTDFEFHIHDKDFVSMLNIGVQSSKRNKKYWVTRLYVTTIDAHYMAEVDNEKFQTYNDAKAEFDRCSHAVITHRGEIIHIKCNGVADFYGVSPRGELIDTRSKAL